MKQTKSRIQKLWDAAPELNLNRLKRVKVNPDHYIAGKGFLKKGAPALLTGGTGSGKSVLGEQYACCVATGTDIFGRIAVPKPRQVLYIEAENDAEVLKEDILSIQKNLKLDPKLLNKNLTFRHVPGLPEDCMGPFLERCFEKVRYDLVVIDPYQSFIGAADINSTEPFLLWRQQIDEIMKEYGCGILLVTHTPKPKGRDEWSMKEYVYLAAGTSAISNWTRTSCELIPDRKEPDRYMLNFSKQGKRAGMTNEGGTIRTSLMIEWSGLADQPYWKVCDNQQPMIMANHKDLVVKCANEHPKWSMRNVSVHTGVALSTVQKYYPKELKKKKRRKKF